MKHKIYQQTKAEIQSKTYINFEAFFVFFLRGGLDPITIQSNHLLGKPRCTLKERLLANLTDRQFLFGP